MSNRRIRRTTIAVSAAALAVLVSACQGTQGKTAAKDPATRSPKASARSTGEKAATGAQLSAMLLKSGEVKGFDAPQQDSAKITKALKGDTGKLVNAEPAACLPLARAVSVLPGAHAAGVAATFGVSGLPEKKKDEKNAAQGLQDAMTAMGGMRMDLLSLSSYEHDGAREEVEALKRSGGACAGGFTLTMSGAVSGSLSSASSAQSGASGKDDGPQTVRIASVAPVATPWGAGASAWTMKVQGQGGDAAMTVVAVEKKGVLLRADTMSFAGGGALDEPLITAQLAKLK